MDINKRTSLIKKASIIGIIGNALLAILKLFIGFFANSMAVISDGIDSTTDIVSSLITLFTAKMITKSPDRKHPYGHFRLETIATQILSFIIFFIGAQLLFSSIIKIINYKSAEMPDIISLYVTVVSILGKILLSLVQFRIGKKTNSSMIIANGYNMLNDTFVSAGILIGLILLFIFKIPFIDSIITLLVSLWIIKTAFFIFKGTNDELMDGNKNLAIYQKVFDAVKDIGGVYNPHRLRIRQLSNFYVIDIDIEVNGEWNVHLAHDAAVKVEQAIKSAIDNVYDVLVHIEPKGNCEINEKYGVKEEYL